MVCDIKLIEEPYAARKIPDHWDKGKKRPVIGKIVVLSGLKLKSRNLCLIHPPTRVVNKNEVHELIATDDSGATPGGKVNDVLYLGFLEVTSGGLVIVGDDITVGKYLIGKITGFNEIHLPNHINIVIRVTPEFANRTNMREGDAVVLDLPLKLGDKVTIQRC